MTEAANADGVTRQEWAAVERYLADLLVERDAALADALEASAAAGLPPHEVSPAHGKLLHLLARAAGARAILELGTLGGYTTIWLARALPPGGRLITLEANREHAEVARASTSAWASPTSSTCVSAPHSRRCRSSPRSIAGRST